MVGAKKGLQQGLIAHHHQPTRLRSQRAHCHPVHPGRLQSLRHQRHKGGGLIGSQREIQLGQRLGVLQTLAGGGAKRELQQVGSDRLQQCVPSCGATGCSVRLLKRLVGTFMVNEKFVTAPAVNPMVMLPESPGRNTAEPKVKTVD